MRFLVDESSGKRLHNLLKSAGHDSVFVGDSSQGLDDESVLRKSEKENRILITDDKDFGELIFKLKRPESGIILLRLSDTSSTTRLDSILYLLNHHHPEGNFITVADDRVKIRKLPS